MIRMLDVYDTWQSEEFLWELMRQRSQEDDPHVNISHREMPSWEEHLNFVESRPYDRWWIIAASVPTGPLPFENAGTLSVTYQNEVGIVLARRWRGKGIGKKALQWLLANELPLPAVPAHRLGQFVANINPANERSIRLFTGLGAVHIQNTYAFEERP